MTDAAATSASTYAQVRVREPIGDRIFGETPTIGGEGANIVVPGERPGTAVQIDRHKGVWIAHPVNDSRVRFNGRLLAGPRDLRRHDVFAVGDAQIVVTDVSRTLLRLEVCHLAGNATISPAGTVSALIEGDGDEELLIQAPHVVPAGDVTAAAAPVSAAELDAAAAQQSSAGAQAPAQRLLSAIIAKLTRTPRTRRFWLRVAAAAVAGLAVMGVISQLNSVALDIEPTDARVNLPGTLLSIHINKHLLLLPGKHLVRAERDGYLPAQVSVTVSTDAPASVRLRLAKLPGTLRIDTADVAATVNIDGVDSGSVPGVVTMSPGSHTITLRAPRYVDYIASVVIEGAGVRQDLKAVLQPSWGTLQISAIPAGAHVTVDGTDSGTTPTVVDVPSGVRRVRISAPNLKTWESSVVLKAGEAFYAAKVNTETVDAMDRMVQAHGYVNYNDYLMEKGRPFKSGTAEQVEAATSLGKAGTEVAMTAATTIVPEMRGGTAVVGSGTKAATEVRAAESASEAMPLVPKGTRSLGEWGEARLAQVLGGAGVKPSKPFSTSLGPRYVDRLEAFFAGACRFVCRQQTLAFGDDRASGFFNELFLVVDQRDRATCIRDLLRFPVNQRKKFFVGRSRTKIRSI